MIHLDTHAVVWLYANELTLFSRVGLARLESDDLFISPIVALELEYLHETGRLTVGSDVICDSLEQAIGLRVCDDSFASVVKLALRQNWTRDPFDRIIVAQAELAGVSLLTRDRGIRKKYRKAFWD